MDLLWSLKKNKKFNFCDVSMGILSVSGVSVPRMEIFITTLVKLAEIVPFLLKMESLHLAIQCRSGSDGRLGFGPTSLRCSYWPRGPF